MAVCNNFGFDIFEALLFIIEFSPYVVALLIGFGMIVASTPAPKFVKILAFLSAPLIVVTWTGAAFVCSWEDAYLRGYDLTLPSMRSQLEKYISTGSSDLSEILESDKYAPTFGRHEMTYLIKDLLTHTFLHSDNHNEDNIDEGYNKGNDWFHYFLGETMMYTSGIYPLGNETLEEAQNHKIDYVAHTIELQEGDKVLDIGCGWSYFSKRFAEEYGAEVMGVTLSKEQLKFGKELNKNNPGVKLYLQDGMKLKERDDLPEGGFDKITSLEMAEHVGIRRYQEFLTAVHSVLKDDGVFYFQVAGLRRSWRYEDLVWGLFMGEWVFPGADASCPLGWVSTQIERAGFEIQMVQNLGTHYSRTIDHWLMNWRNNKDDVVKKYGETAFRRWEVFLAWSVRVARQGSSTLFTFALTKAGQEKRRIKTQAHLAPGSVAQRNFTLAKTGYDDLRFKAEGLRGNEHHIYAETS